jgi:drug/metabolite transporter (DMT)-like permease
LTLFKVGELAALTTAVSWTFTALFFTAAAQRIGSLPVNWLRLVLACGYFVVHGALLRGHPLPTDAPAHVWLWLSLSGFVGFTFGDLCLFRAYLLIGPRLASLFMCLVPPLAALLGWAALGETLSAGELAAMAVVVAAVALVVSEPRSADSPHPQDSRLTGCVLAFGGALGQALGLILSKHGMQGYDAFAATQVRVFAGLLGFTLILSVAKHWGRVRTALRDARALTFTALGAFFGPFVGVGLSLVAVQHTQAGVAATLMALTPVLLVPTVFALYGERVTPRAVVGTAVAFAGVALLLL